ncbi:hypothetical protein CIK05_13845 [Bdellovibrio sp. qaytius]|nr:hypothetical protein CIK05_13845 [Bdellovibrio sp. qaytius]
MKTLLVSLLLFAFAQGAQAAPVALNEMNSKKLYNTLAAYGLRDPYPADMQTREWAKPVICQKVTSPSVSYTCLLHDEFHNMNVQKTGLVAKQLYMFVMGVNGADCEEYKCITKTTDIKCIYWWPNKNNPPPRRYLCVIEQISAGLD